MNTNKFITGGIAGGIVSFLLGWVVYGVLLKDFYAANCGTATGAMREMPIMWALVVGNLGFGFFISYIFSKWAMVSTAGGGAQAGAMIGLLSALGWDFIMYATMNLSNMTSTIVDIIVSTIMSALVGAVVGMVLGMGNKK